MHQYHAIKRKETDSGVSYVFDLCNQTTTLRYEVTSHSGVIFATLPEWSNFTPLIEAFCIALYDVVK